MKHLVEVYDKGEEKLHVEFDMLNFAQRNRDLLIMKKWIEKTNKNLEGVEA